LADHQGEAADQEHDQQEEPGASHGASDIRPSGMLRMITIVTAILNTITITITNNDYQPISN